MTPPFVDERAEDLRHLRSAVSPLLRLGSSSWNFPGWEGIVYRRKYPATGAVAKMLGDYARYPLFGTVGVDSSYYRPLSQATWRSYAKELPPDFPCLTKVWHRITAHTFTGHQDGGVAGQPNTDFLNAELCVNEVIGPALEAGGGNVGPFIFELQTIARAAGLRPTEFADRLDRFLSVLPPEAQYAVELRNPEYLTPGYFAVLRASGVAHVFSAWTRMPAIGEQLDHADSVTASFLVGRATVSPGRAYDESMDLFSPFDRIRAEDPALRSDLVRLARLAESLRLPAYLIVGNRTEGCSPLTIEAVMRQLATRS